MDTNEFVDYYELLQLSPNADFEMIERVYRHLAKKFHPDHTESGDKELFLQIVEAHRTLANPETRAGYDAKYQDYWNQKWKIASAASDRSALDIDRLTRERLLSLLYVQRRRNMKSPGIGDHEMARLLSTPPEMIEFHLWYLKAKGWVERLETGHLAITALGVDVAEENRRLLSPERLIEVRTGADRHAEAGGPDEGDTEGALLEKD